MLRAIFHEQQRKKKQEEMMAPYNKGRTPWEHRLLQTINECTVHVIFIIK